MAFVLGRFVGQLRHGDALTVVSVQRTCPGAFEDILLGKGKDNTASTLAIEVFLVEELSLTLSIEQFHVVDELQVGTKDRNLFTAVGLFTGLLGESRHYGMSYGQWHSRLGLFAGSTHDDVASINIDAGGSVNTYHVVADNLEVGHLLATGEFYFCHGVET